MPKGREERPFTYESGYNTCCRIEPSSLKNNLKKSAIASHVFSVNEELYNSTVSHFIFEKISIFKQQVLMINENINIAVDLHRTSHF